MIGVEPIRPQRTLDFESSASANSATPAYLQLAPLGTKGGNRIWTGDKGFADLCLTTWLYRHERIKSSKIGVAGFEPAHHGIKTRCLTAWLYPNMVEGSGFEPPNPKERIYSPPRLARLRYPSIMVARDGIEPPTQGASILCSTDWATEPKIIYFQYNGPSRIWTGDLLRDRQAW